MTNRTDNAVFEEAIEESSELIMEVFEGMGIPDEGDQREGLEYAIRFALRSLLAEWCA